MVGQGGGGKEDETGRGTQMAIPPLSSWTRVSGFHNREGGSARLPGARRCARREKTRTPVLSASGPPLCPPEKPAFGTRQGLRKLLRRVHCSPTGGGRRDPESWGRAPRQPRAPGPPRGPRAQQPAQPGHRRESCDSGGTSRTPLAAAGVLESFPRKPALHEPLPPEPSGP